MDKVKLELTIELDGDCDKNYVQQLAEKVANALEHEANEVASPLTMGLASNASK